MQVFQVNILFNAVFAVHASADARIVAYIDWAAATAHQVDEILIERIVHIVGQGVLAERHEISGRHLVCVLAYLRDPLAGQDVNEFFIDVMKVKLG